MINISEEEKNDLYTLFNYYLLFTRSGAVDLKATPIGEERAVEQIREGIQALICLRNKDYYAKVQAEFNRNEDFDWLFDQLFTRR